MVLLVPTAGTEINVTNFGKPVADAVNLNTADVAALKTATAVTPWVLCTMLNAFTPYGGTYQAPRYRKVGDIVYVEGGTAGGAIGSTAFTLPVGFRPPKDHQYSVSSYGIPGIVAINTAGSCYPNAPTDIRFIGWEFNFSVLA